MSTPPLKDFFASPALSLSLAGVFRNAEAVGEDEVEEGETESGGGCQRASVDISSENTGPGRSEEDGEEKSPEEEEEDEEEGDGEIGANNKRKKRRKKYHRHTTEQIREMEALFRESPHPDEKQREQLSKQLGLAPRQIKFWFQNRRTQIKAIQERHENSLLKSEIDNLREENQRIRESVKNACCPSCSGPMASSEENGTITGERLLLIENMRLKSEIEKLKEMMGRRRRRANSPTPSRPTAVAMEESGSGGGSCMDDRAIAAGVLGLEKSTMVAVAAAAMDELTKMASANEPLWIRSVETGRDILNYDEYAREFVPGDPNGGQLLHRRCDIEASRETAGVILDVSRLTRAFIDVNQWKDMFPGLVSKAAIVDVISEGEPNGAGQIQLMFAELQLLTPMVPAREVYFVRYCKQHSPEKWVVADVSVDVDASFLKCRKRPSGCIIEDKANGHCKITWIEHVACQRIIIPKLFRPIISTGLAFGARHWMATLQQQCERQVFSMATNVPTRDTIGVSTMMGRKSMLSLAQRMTNGFYRAVGATDHVDRKRIPVKCGVDDMRISSRKNLNDPREPIGMILCATSSIWLPIAPHVLFGFLTNDSRRNEWDVMFNGTPTDMVAYLAKGQDRGNSIAIHGIVSKDERSKMWLLQDRSTNGFESTVVFAPADINAMQTAIAGCDSGKIAILPSGFSILPDGMETRPQVIMRSRREDGNVEGGSLLTFAVQMLADPSPSAEVTTEVVDNAGSLVSCVLKNVRRALQCEDGS